MSILAPGLPGAVEQRMERAGVQNEHRSPPAAEQVPAPGDVADAEQQIAVWHAEVTALEQQLRSLRVQLALTRSASDTAPAAAQTQAPKSAREHLGALRVPLSCKGQRGSRSARATFHVGQKFLTTAGSAAAGDATASDNMLMSREAGHLGDTRELREVREAREAREAAAGELSRVSARELAEVKHLKRPPPSVRHALEAVWMLLVCERVETQGGPCAASFCDAKQSWARCLRMLADEEFVGRVLRFDFKRLDGAPRVAKYLFSLVLGIQDDSTVQAFVAEAPKSKLGARGHGGPVSRLLDVEAVARAHAPCGALVRWMRALLAEYGACRGGRREVTSLESEIAGIEAKLDQARSTVQRWQAVADRPQRGERSAEMDAVDGADELLQRGAGGIVAAAKAALAAAASMQVERATPRPGTCGGPLPSLGFQGDAEAQLAAATAAAAAGPLPTAPLWPAPSDRDRCRGAQSPLPLARPATRNERPTTALEIAPPELAPLKSRWADGLDTRPKVAETFSPSSKGPSPQMLRTPIGGRQGRNALPRNAPQLPRGAGRGAAGLVAGDGRVELSLEAPPESCERALLQLRVSFRQGSSDVHEQDLEQSKALRRLVSLVKQDSWIPKLRVEGRREAGEPDGMDSERALAVYRWLVDRGHVEPGSLRLRIAKESKAERCVVFRPFQELTAVSGPAQTELVGLLPPGLFFDFATSNLTEATLVVIEAMGRWLQAEEWKSAPVTVEGHADRSEKDVSLARARAVRDALAFHGVCTKRIRVQACRAWHPLSPTVAGLNRRVEIHLC
mmetsp:Transcript_123539/g.218824  ORF Transcript_123539/g.218824 Transcript_123539/m.218824 type:complete len:794 (-) Transcript_123539:55-2436(-)